MKGKRITVKERKEALTQSPIERRKVFKELLDHVGKGYSIKSFSELSEESINNYLKAFPEEFDREELDRALRKGMELWENIGYRQANGSCIGNSRTWYYNMANRYGWREKLEVEAEHKGSIAVQVVSYATQKALGNTVSDDRT